MLQEDIDVLEPVEELEELCELVKGYDYEIHRHDAGEYSYLDEESICITVINPYTREKLFLDLEDEFTLTFNVFHEHYDAVRFGYEEMVHTLKQILNNEVCIAAIYWGKDKKWMGSTLIGRDEIENTSVKEIFSFIFETKEFRNRLKLHGGEADFIFWNPVYNIVKKIEAAHQ